MRAGHPGARQIKITADPYLVPQQARKPATSGECQLMKLRALHHGRRLELAVIEPQRERHLQPGQVQRSGDHRARQPHTARIDLIPELGTVPSHQPARNVPASDATSKPAIAAVAPGRRKAGPATEAPG